MSVDFSPMRATLSGDSAIDVDDRLHAGDAKMDKIGSLG